MLKPGDGVCFCRRRRSCHNLSLVQVYLTPRFSPADGSFPSFSPAARRKKLLAVVYRIFASTHKAVGEIFFLAVALGKALEQGRMLPVFGLKPCSFTFAFFAVFCVTTGRWAAGDPISALGGSTSGCEETVDHICQRACLCFHLHKAGTDFA